MNKEPDQEQCYSKRGIGPPSVYGSYKEQRQVYGKEQDCHYGKRGLSFWIDSGLISVVWGHMGVYY
jgi:hypothetical protein